MTSPQAFTHGPETANPAKKGRIRSFCEALGSEGYGGITHFYGPICTGGIPGQAVTSLRSGRFERLVCDGK